MSNVMRFFSIGLIFSCGIFSSFAGQWESAAVDIKAKPEEPFVEVVFRYTRDTSGLDKMPEFGVWPEGVKLLTGVVSYTPLLGPGDVQKEAADVFRFQIPVGCLAGEHAISIPLVNSTEPKELKVILKVPEWVEIKPRRIIWKRGEAAESKTTSIVSVTREGVMLTKVEPSDDSFDVILERQAAQLYSVKITPKDITKPTRTVIRVIGTDIHGRETSFNLYAEIL